MRMHRGLHTTRCVNISSTTSKSRLALWHCGWKVTNLKVRAQENCSPQCLTQTASAPSRNSIYLDHATSLPMRRAHSSLRSLTLPRNLDIATLIIKSERERSSWSCKWHHLRRQARSRSLIKIPRKWSQASLQRGLKEFRLVAERDKETVI